MGIMKKLCKEVGVRNCMVRRICILLGKVTYIIGNRGVWNAIVTHKLGTWALDLVT
jgi:hypothetical protein